MTNPDGHLYCIEASSHGAVAEWKPQDGAAATGSSQEPGVLLSLSTVLFSDDAYLITAIDNSGFCFLTPEDAAVVMRSVTSVRLCLSVCLVCALSFESVDL